MIDGSMYCLLVSIKFAFFFNDTATTEIYTYGHTLSLPDALPILRRAPPPAVRGVSPARRPDGATRSNGPAGSADCQRRRERPDRGAGAPWPRSAGCPSPVPCDRDDSPPRPSPRRPVSRSEEHTSELQSLMRISYAVFCLKKTKQNH